VRDDVRVLGGRDPRRLWDGDILGLECFNPGTEAREKLDVRLLTADDVADAEALHRRARASLTDPTTLRLDTAAFFRDHLGERGCIIGVFQQRRMIAYGVLGFPDRRDDDWGRDVRLPDDEVERLAYLDGASVDAGWRGCGLQRALALIRLELARARGRRHALSTVAPKNFYSWRNLMMVGLRIKGMAVKYGLGWRFILHARIGAQVDALEGPSGVARLDDYALQRRLLQAGYWGHACVETASGARAVAFARPAVLDPRSGKSQAGG